MRPESGDIAITSPQTLTFDILLEKHRLDSDDIKRQRPHPVNSARCGLAQLKLLPAISYQNPLRCCAQAISAAESPEQDTLDLSLDPYKEEF